MIFRAPNLPTQFVRVVEAIAKLRDQLRFATNQSLNRWTGVLARMTLAKAIQESNAMEGIHATFDDAIAAVDREDPIGPRDADWQALLGHREAMEYIIQLSKDPTTYAYSEGTLLGLHYMMLKYDLTKHPGRWRPGGVFVTNTVTGQLVYEGPPASMVPELMAELIATLNTKTAEPVLVKAAMAHLNLAMIHPFKDGNGRMARALQTMVLSKETILSPVFSSIEEYVGQNSKAYYEVLAEVGQGAWNPRRNALPWIRFCLVAHFQQATTLLRRVEETSALMNMLEAEAKDRKLNPRVVPALADAAIGLRVTNQLYRKQAEISNQLAKLDLSSLVKAGLLVAKGERRGRLYLASESLEKLRNKTRIPATSIDPFELTKSTPNAR